MAPMKAWDVNAIRDLMLEAGRVAMEHFESPSITTKHDSSIVTAADHAIEELLRARLAPDGGEAAFVGEESVLETTADSMTRALSGPTWVVDPIDGTAPYANGLPNWGISLGLLEDGRFSHGAIFLPRIGELFITDGDRVRHERGSRDERYWQFSRLEARGAVDIPYRRTGMLSLPSEITHRGRFDGGNPVQSIGSAVYSVAKVITGGYLCYVARVKLWDIAGGIPILRRLGFRIEDEAGVEIPDVVSESHWVLDADSPRLWKCRGLLYIGHAKETLDHVRAHFHTGHQR